MVKFISENNSIKDEGLKDMVINDVVQLYHKLKEQGLTRDEIIEKLKEIDKQESVQEEKMQILKESNAVKVELTQSIEYNIEPEDDEYEVDEERAIEDIEIDTTAIADDLLEYLKEYSYNDEYKEVYNSAERVTVDVDDNISVVIELNKDFDDETLKDVFADFIHEIVLQDDQFNGFGSYIDSMDHDEDIDDEYGNYSRTIDVVDDEWDVEYTYTIETTGEQNIEIKR